MASAAEVGSCTGGGVLGGGNENNGGGGSLAPSIGGSLGRERRNKKHMQDASDDELDSSQHLPVLERVKSDRAPITKPEEDRRRRTIIVEKKGGSYGFTLQSYGIHYKKEQEIEMITYVDYVEYDGPAYRAGMREGDVILSINGTDMEKADHKTLVAFIKDCDTRMRMVVLFEDCVRKVELHMKYLQLQNVLQSKMNELERVCLRERQLLEGKWKTHSLPARKKTTTSPTENATTPSENDVQPTLYHRPALSTEDVMNVGRQRHAIIPPPAQFMLTYQYLDPNVRYVLKPSTSSSSGEYFVSVGTASGQSDRHYILARASSTETNASIAAAYQQHAKKYESPKPPLLDPHRATSNEEYLQRSNEQPKSTKSGGRHCHGPSCNPCLGHFRKKVDKNGDNVSLDAYDLASPCCDPHCVPTRRRSRHHKEHHHKHKHRDRETKERQRPRSQSHASPNPNHHHHHQRQTYPHQQQPNEPTKSRYSDLTAGLASHCSLHSCTSSEFAPVESSASYTTSLSTDTLYWDPQSDNTAGNSRQHSTKSKQSFQVLPNASKQQLQQQAAHLQQGVFQQRYHLHATQIQPASHIYHHSQYVHKPKSWDNLTTKAFGGYGFGYGYLDTVGPKPTIKMQVAQQRHSIPRKNPYGRYSTFTDVENYAPPPSQFVEETTTTTITTKSTENLINTFNISETNLRCDCTDQTKMKKPPLNLVAPISTPGAGHQYQPSTGHSLPGTIQKIECRSGYYSNLPRTNNASTSTRNGGVATISEITRL